MKKTLNWPIMFNVDPKPDPALRLRELLQDPVYNDFVTIAARVSLESMGRSDVDEEQLVHYMKEFFTMLMIDG